MYQSYIKRICDVVIAIMLLPFLAILMIPIGIIIKLDDRGPVFFKGPRLGKDMKEFRMFKFRTMKVNAPDIRNEDGSTFNSDEDFRLTRVGKFLRKTSLDELPQIINILKGEMSFVGPRPSPLGNKDKYPEEFFKKFNIRPGITGYNQAILRNLATMEERVKNDVYYVENVSMKLDIKIIFMTIDSVLKSKNVNRFINKTGNGENISG